MRRNVSDSDAVGTRPRLDVANGLSMPCSVIDQENLVRPHMMERRGGGVPIIFDESRELSGRLPEYTLLDDSELRLVMWSASRQESNTT